MLLEACKASGTEGVNGHFEQHRRDTASVNEQANIISEHKNFVLYYLYLFSFL